MEVKRAPLSFGADTGGGGGAGGGGGPGGGGGGAVLFPFEGGVGAGFEGAFSSTY